MAETSAPEGYYFTEKHEWVKLEGDIALIGITDYAQSSLGDIVYVDLPKEGSSLRQMESFGTIESVKAAEDLYAPVSGEVVEVNPEIGQNPALINSDPFHTWFIKVKLAQKEELSFLMDMAKYKEYIAGLD